MSTNTKQTGIFLCKIRLENISLNFIGFFLQVVLHIFTTFHYRVQYVQSGAFKVSVLTTL